MTRSTFTTLCTSALTAILVIGAIAPAGSAAPMIIRQVSIGGAHVSAYYSVVDGGYRPIFRHVLTADTSASHRAEMADAVR